MGNTKHTLVIVVVILIAIIVGLGFGFAHMLSSTHVMLSCSGGVSFNESNAETNITDLAKPSIYTDEGKGIKLAAPSNYIPGKKPKAP